VREMPSPERQPEVSLTLTARAKAHRLYNEYELRDRVRNERGTLFRKGESNEHHLVESGRSIVVVIEDDGARTVTTQMHAHPDYRTDNTYQQLGELP
jgi:hypothetical protein